VTVSSGSKRVEIHYRGLSLGAPEKVRYRYMIEGLDDGWIDVGNQPVAYLADPKPGKFRFRVLPPTSTVSGMNRASPLISMFNRFSGKPGGSTRH